MTPPLLQLDQLSIAYNPHSEWAVSEVSLTLKAGDRLVLGEVRVWEIDPRTGNYALPTARINSLE